jgi:hypothetical protein
MGFSRHPVEDTGLLRMTEWVVEIATSFNQKTVDLLAMTDLDRYFHPHQVEQSNMSIYPSCLFWVGIVSIDFATDRIIRPK